VDDESGGHNKLEKSILHNQRLNLHSLSLKDMREITNDFSDERLLGQGGFGRVYKVRLNPTFSITKLCRSGICYPYQYQSLNREF